MNRTLPTDSAARKGFPIFSGCIAYFAAALAGVARWSKLGNDKHNPGEPMHHARGKSTDHRDCIPRHLMDLADIEAAVARREPEFSREEWPAVRAAAVAAILDEADALAWRALALSQELHEKYGGAPLAPGARLPEAAPVEVPPRSIDTVTVTLDAGPIHKVLDKIKRDIGVSPMRAKAAKRRAKLPGRKVPKYRWKYR